MDDPAGLAATHSVDVLLKGGVSDQPCSFGDMLYWFVLSDECPHLKIEIWGTRFGGCLQM
jgi:hypothetical protein